MPLWALQITAEQSPSTLARRLAGDTTSPGWNPGGLSYDGWVRFPWFILAKTRPYMNSFAPILIGRFSSTNSGTRVSVLLVLHPFAVVFTALLLWLSSSCIFDVLFALFLLAGFTYEASRAKRDLQSSMLLGPTGQHAA